jgi:site-specific recombinase XerC
MSPVEVKLASALAAEIGRRLVEGLSAHTIRAMHDSAASLLRVVDPRNVLDAGALAQEHVVQWVEEMRAQHLAPSTLLVRFRYLNILLGGLAQAGVIPTNPAGGLRAPRASVPLVKFPDDEAIEHLLNPLRYHDMNGPRDLALIWFLTAAGLRRSELIGMRWSEDPERSDLDLAASRARVLGKGRKERVVPLMPGMVSTLEVYLEMRSRLRRSHLPHLWLGQRGALSASSVNAIVKLRGESAGIPHLHPHALRHAWTNRMLGSGVSEGDVMMLGGWSSRAMLSRYGAYAASERALAAVNARIPELEPWGRTNSAHHFRSSTPPPTRARKVSPGLGSRDQRGRE